MTGVPRGRRLILAALVLVPALPLPSGAGASSPAPRAPVFASCEAMWSSYPWGVARSRRAAVAKQLVPAQVAPGVFTTNASLDDDGDGVACERTSEPSNIPASRCVDRGPLQRRHRFRPSKELRDVFDDQLSRSSLRRMVADSGPFGTWLDDTGALDQWVDSLVERTDPASPFAYLPSLARMLVHEGTHGTQFSDLSNDRCIRTGPGAGFLVPERAAGFPDDAPFPQGRLKQQADRVARERVSNPFLLDTALGVNVHYLDGVLGEEGYNQQLIELNAYALDGEWAASLSAIGVPAGAGTTVLAVKMMQFKLYLQRAHSRPDFWSSIQDRTTVAATTWTWNLATRQLTTTIRRSDVGREIWDLAFGPDLAIVREFTRGKMLEPPPRPGR